MKKKIFASLTLSALLLSGCFLNDFFKKEPNGEEKGESTIPDNPHKEYDPTLNGEFYGEIKEGKYVGYEFSASLEETGKPTTGVGEVNIYAFNDFHGNVLGGNNSISLKQLGTFYKEKSILPNTLIFDQGDTYQGSLESNYDYGSIVQDVFNYANVSLRTVGNHDFDWGVEKLESLVNRKYQNEYIPCLASNVYNFKDGQIGQIQQKQLGLEYATFTLSNGIKVGVVGIIGRKQISDICSTLVEDIAFSNHITKVKDISNFLRNEKDCDLVVASCHEQADPNMLDLGLTDISPISNKRYVDLVLNGHSHNEQNYIENNVKFVQWYGYGGSTGLVTLKYDFENNVVLDNETQVETFYPDYFNNNYSNVDPTIEEMVDDYLKVVTPLGEEVLSTNFLGYYTTTNLGYLMSEAIYDYASKSGESIDFAVTNYARSTFSGSTFTYHDLYKSFPFDNKIYIYDISLDKSIDSLFSNMTYRFDTSIVPTHGNTYKIVIVDYVGLHKNIYKEYDYFPDANTSNVLPLNYREVLKSYLLDNPEKNFSKYNYSDSNEHFVHY